MKEEEKFTSIADKWWDVDGPFRFLHQTNHLRMQFIEECSQKHMYRKISGLDILDVGCGGGILSEALLKAGGGVVAIDVGQQNIDAAKLHAQENNCTSIEYICTSLEEFNTEKKFDIVCCMEVIEHCENPSEFIKKLCSFVNKEGLLFISTINRTVKSYALAIFLAEYVLNFLPKGTHEWCKFLKPSEVERMVKKCDFSTLDLSGMIFSIKNLTWQLADNIDVNYLLCAKREFFDEKNSLQD